MLQISKPAVWILGKNPELDRALREADLHHPLIHGLTYTSGSHVPDLSAVPVGVTEPASVAPCLDLCIGDDIEDMQSALVLRFSEVISLRFSFGIEILDIDVDKQRTVVYFTEEHDQYIQGRSCTAYWGVVPHGWRLFS